MQLSKTEECLMLDYHLQNGAEDHVADQVQKCHLRIPVEEAISRFRASVCNNTTNDEWDNYLKARKLLFNLFLRRRYDVWNFFMTDESVKKLYPDGPPEIVNVDHDVLPPKTLQLGLYLLYLTTQVTKEEDEDEIEFERRKDWHDWFNGYVNQEAIQRPLFTITEVWEEMTNKREIVNNHIGFFFDSLST